MLLVVVCVADLVHMTYRKIVSQSSAAAVEQTGMEALQLTSDNVQAGTAFVEQQDRLTFEGQLAVDKQEIPWQTNCGVVQDEATGTSIFLTPNTALAFACKPSAGSHWFLQQKSSRQCSLFRTDAACEYRFLMPIRRRN